MPKDALVPLDDLASILTGRGIPERLLTLGKFGTAHQFYIPWMQASYIMVANKAALPYLPRGVDINALSYDELAAWANMIQEKTGQRMLGFGFAIAHDNCKAAGVEITFEEHREARWLLNAPRRSRPHGVGVHVTSYAGSPS